jgi:tetratricopeptide (TPR) repeat protein
LTARANSFSRSSDCFESSSPLKRKIITVDQQTKAELKHDNFVDVTTHGLSWASENRRSVIVTSVALLGVILILVAGVVFYNNRSQAASVAFGDAMAAYQAPIAQPGQPIPVGMKTYNTIGERAKAATALFLAAADKYGMTPAGKNALYFAGLTSMEAGENASAESTFKKVADGWNGDLAALAKLSLAQLYRQTGRSSQAIEIYNQLTAKPTTTVPAGLAQIQLAELYEGQNQPDAAKKNYAQLKDKDAKGAAGMLAAQKLNPPPAQPALPPQ